MQALGEEMDSSASVVEELVARGLVSEETVLNRLAEEFSLPRVNPLDIATPQRAIAGVERQFCLDNGMLFYDRRGSSVKAAIYNPLELEKVDHFSQVMALDIEPYLASKEAILQAIERVFPENTETIETLHREISPSRPEGDSGNRSTFGSDRDPGTIVSYVELIMREALKRGASDIHLEPLEKRFRIRFRIDGILHEAENPPKRLQPAIISRIKLMSQMSIAEKRLPQDGRIQMDVDGRSIDFRVSAVPSAHGETLTLRLLDKESLKQGLAELGLLPDDQARFERIISLPDGIILASGPTGSGKSTTLYSCLNYLNKSDRKIITVEDPVEYQLGGINQVQVRSEIGMTFSAGLRAMLRQSPNIIMVGEIRDLETVEIAINASLTGHLVFSTLHTNDAPSAISRLRDLGVEPFLIASSMRAVMAQRLVRRLCAECCQPGQLREMEVAAVESSGPVPDGAQWNRPVGCPACRGTGYKGRIGVFELMEITSEMGSLIYSGGSLAAMRSLARDQGMLTMRQDGLRKAARGITSVEEALS
ncbi:MAG: type II/IV secretion system protein, partial [Opitutae bacterium]|nr:type II/IV secretion system protein [Opitutae bacterium]